MSSVPMSCRTCREGLGTITDSYGLTTYKHNAELIGDRGKPDHIAMPVPTSSLADPVRRCDFCNREASSGWIYTSVDMTTESRRGTRRTIDALEYHSRNQASRTRVSGSQVVMRGNADPVWGACDDCAEVIEKRDTYGLVARAIETMPASRTRGKRLVLFRGVLHGNYETLFANLVGERTRYECNVIEGEVSA